MSSVLLEVDHELATLTLNRSRQSNAIDEDMGKQLSEAVQDLRTRPDLRALLIRGNGPRFSVGGDLKYLNHFHGEARSKVVMRMTEAFQETMLGLYDLGAPIVVAARGAVAGGALGFLSVADFVLISPDTTFSVGSSTVGLPLDGGTTWLLPRVIGLRRAAEMYYEGRVASAEEAVAWGLASRIIDNDTLDDASLEVAQTLSSRSNDRAFEETRRLFHSAFDNSWQTQLQLELEAMRRAVASPSVTTRPIAIHAVDSLAGSTRWRSRIKRR